MRITEYCIRTVIAGLFCCLLLQTSNVLAQARSSAVKPSGKSHRNTTQLNEPTQVIILKADDLVFHDSVQVFNPCWETYLDYIISKNIPSSVGVIMNSLDKGNKKYVEKVRMLQEKNGIELWNHGYTHDMNGKTESGEKAYEFLRTTEQFQYGQFIKSQKAAREKLGITIRTFGSPGNGMDANTTKAIDAIPELEVWLYGDPASTKFVLKRLPGCDAEHPVHNPDFEHFKSHYDPAQPYLVMQYHPMSWDERRFGEFKKIIDFLLQKPVRFMTPYAYYQEMRSGQEELPPH